MRECRPRRGGRRSGAWGSTDLMACMRDNSTLYEQGTVLLQLLTKSLGVSSAPVPPPPPPIPPTHASLTQIALLLPPPSTSPPPACLRVGRRRKLVALPHQHQH
eukprot:758728-Hanusia_phi.AAC.2